MALNLHQKFLASLLIVAKLKERKSLKNQSYIIEPLSRDQ
jgi:hypothetical protein